MERGSSWAKRVEVVEGISCIITGSEGNGKEETMWGGEKEGGGVRMNGKGESGRTGLWQFVHLIGRPGRRDWMSDTAFGGLLLFGV